MQTEPKMPFSQFIRLAWPHIGDPNPYVHGWHIEAIAAELQESIESRTNIVLNSPPGTTKTIITRVMYPAYIWGSNPQAKIVVYNKNDEQIEGLEALLKLLRSDWYQEIWRTTAITESNTTSILEKDISTAIENGDGGSIRFVRHLNAIHYDILVMDSPQRPIDVHRQRLQAAYEWFRQHVTSRGIVGGRQVIIAQSRLADNDLTAQLLQGDDMAGGDWKHVCLPMRFDPDHKYKYDCDRRSVEGELLWPEAMPENRVAALVRVMQLDRSQVNVETQLQQQ